MYVHMYVHMYVQCMYMYVCMYCVYMPWALSTQQGGYNVYMCALQMYLYSVSKKKCNQNITECQT